VFGLFSNDHILRDNVTGKSVAFGSSEEEYARAAQFRAECLAKGHTVSDDGTGTLSGLRNLGYDDQGRKHNTGPFGLW